MAFLSFVCAAVGALGSPATTPSAQQEPGSAPDFQLVLYRTIPDPGTDENLECAAGFRVVADFSRHSLYGFAAGLTVPQVNAIRRDEQIDRVISGSATYVVTLTPNWPSAADVIGVLEQRVGFISSVQFAGKSLYGFGAVLTPLQLALLAAEPNVALIGLEPHRWIVVFAMERPAYLEEVRTDELERSLGFQTTHRYHSALNGFAAPLTAAQLAALSREPDIGVIVPDQTSRLFRPGEPQAACKIAPATVRRALRGAFVRTYGRVHGPVGRVLYAGYSAGYTHWEYALARFAGRRPAARMQLVLFSRLPRSPWLANPTGRNAVVCGLPPKVGRVWLLKPRRDGCYLADF